MTLGNWRWREVSLHVRFMRTNFDFTILLFLLTFHRPREEKTLRRAKSGNNRSETLFVSSFGIMLTRNALHKHPKSMATNKQTDWTKSVFWCGQNAAAEKNSEQSIAPATHRESIILLFFFFFLYFGFSHSKNISIVQAITHATHPKQTMRIKDKTTKMMLRLTSSTQLRMNEGSGEKKKKLWC